MLKKNHYFKSIIINSNFIPNFILIKFFNEIDVNCHFRNPVKIVVLIIYLSWVTIVLIIKKSFFFVKMVMLFHILFIILKDYPQIHQCM